ncbi:MAG: hypothetical protein DI629_03390 [Mesorhizobium amorphae]|nr:MAG: hypothetical protein DI629_03390 [Mesorhizobium amorphae]
MSASNYLENKLLDHALGVANFVRPTNLYAALHTADPGENGAVAEIVGNGYARQAVSFGAAVNGVGANTTAPQFPVATADWGSITHWSLWDAQTGGNCLLSGALVASRQILNTDQFYFAVGDLTVTMD